MDLQSRGGRVDNAQALRACGPTGPRGFESLPRRQAILQQHDERSLLNGVQNE